MDATSLKFPDGSFDLLFSRSVLEHIHPLEKLFDEIGRVMRPGGIVYHEIDPFFWLRGCHKRGLVDIPWAHARLTPGEYHRYVAKTEGPRAAEKRLERLMTLNRLTLRQWKALIENGPFDLIDWEESPSSIAEDILREFPDVTSTLLPDVSPGDLVVGRARACLRRRSE
jgi:ubiquinone/menaquinone biosynthesis C-methylase UbiE